MASFAIRLILLVMFRQLGVKMKHMESLYKVATGQIENPSIELEIEGEKQKFEGRDARVFAFGILAGLKIGRDDCQANLETNFSET